MTRPRGSPTTDADQPTLFSRMAWVVFVSDDDGRPLLHGRHYPTVQIAEQAARNAGYVVGRRDELGRRIV